MAATSFYGSQSTQQQSQQQTSDGLQHIGQNSQAGSSTQATSTAAAGGSGSVQTTRAAAEEARKDRTLAEFLLMLDDYDPLVRSRMHISSSAMLMQWKLW
jgi:hypothetical protein